MGATLRQPQGRFRDQSYPLLHPVGMQPLREDDCPFVGGEAENEHTSVHSARPVWESGVWLCLFSLFFSSPFQGGQMCSLAHAHDRKNGKRRRGTRFRDEKGLGLDGLLGEFFKFIYF